MRSWDLVDFAWAAGFWDGEGCVSLTYRNGQPRIVVQVAQVDREVLDKFCSIMEFGNVLGPYFQTNENAQPYYVWRVEGNTHLQRLKMRIGPWLGTVKLDQINKALKARKEWEDTAQCSKGHRLSKSPKGHWRCAECQSVQGKINATARWAKQKDQVM